MELDPIIWHSNREVDYCPKHFIKAKTLCNPESRLWIYENCKGRFCFTNENTDNFLLLLYNSTNVFPAFENETDAIMFELTWS
jgi:hypothetical protein